MGALLDTGIFLLIGLYLIYWLAGFIGFLQATSMLRSARARSSA